MKIASYNIHKCKGLDGRVRPDRILKVISELGADVIALQEVDRRFGRRVGILDPFRIRHETGMQLLVQSDEPQGHGWHGNALLVRGEPRAYHRSRIRLPGFEPRGAVVAELDLGEGMFRVIAAHLGLLRASRLDQARAILHAFEQLPPMPTILLGDLNEWRRGPRSSLGVLETAFHATPHVSSFPTRRPLFALDRIFGWPQGLISDLAIHHSPLARVASDHLPLTGRVKLARSKPEGVAA